MVRKIVFIYFAIIVIIFTNSSYSDDNPGELSWLLQKALSSNPDILAVQHEERAAKFRAKSEGWLPDPTVSIAASNLPRTSLAPDETPMSGIALGISQKIPWFGKLHDQKQIANLEFANSGLSKEAKELAVIRMVKTAYYEYSYWKIAEVVVDENLDLMESLVEVAQTKYANGEGLAQDVLSAQTTLSKLEDRKSNVVKMQKAALANLRALLDSSDPGDFKLNGDLPQPAGDIRNLEIIKSEAWDNNPSLEYSSNAIEIAGKENSLAKSEYYPDLALGFEYRIRERVPMDAVDGEDFVSAKLSLDFPLWFMRNQRNKTAETRQRVYAAEFKKRSVERELEYALTELFLDLERTYESITLYENSIIPLAQSTLESSNIAYQVGKVDFLNLLTAQMKLLELRLEKLNAVKEYNQKSARIDELTGKLEVR